MGVGRFVAPVLPPPWRPAVVQTMFLETSSAQMMVVGTVVPGEGQQTAAEPTPIDPRRRRSLPASRTRRSMARQQAFALRLHLPPPRAAMRARSAHHAPPPAGRRCNNPILATQTPSAERGAPRELPLGWRRPRSACVGRAEATAAMAGSPDAMAHVSTREPGATDASVCPHRSPSHVTPDHRAWCASPAVVVASLRRCPAWPPVR